jgi:hypothetical protein
MEAENVFEAVNAVFARVAADARVDDSVVVPAVVKVALKVVRPGVAGIDAEACGNAVAETGNDGEGVRRSGNG